MLDNYKDKQDLIYNLMIRAINNDKISHAYLIESNKNITVDDFVLAIIKTIVCPNHYTNSTLCNMISFSSSPKLLYLLDFSNIASVIFLLILPDCSPF